jgi:hypothetical protein
MKSVIQVHVHAKNQNTHVLHNFNNKVAIYDT